jgi:ABC-type polysaccharide/polyol phosphate transport system ATPase subunit
MDAIVEAFGRRIRHRERVALSSVDLEVKRGEIVGILGRNGAGKSTLLKIIAGTLERTAGDLEVNGRVTAILELGTGFHPDYTGRENIYMGGLCLGMTRAEIDKKLDSIIEFSELGSVIDNSFKTYSTGMQARLTFSTAISVDPDILIVDEALSVGDARFQLKCFGRLERLRENQTTILLVSHDPNTITALCDHAIILENGTVYAAGESKEITMLYHNLLFGKRPTPAPSSPIGTHKPEQASGLAGDVTPYSRKDRHPTSDSLELPQQARVPGTSGSTQLRYGSGAARVSKWGLFTQDGEPASIVESGSPCVLSMTLNCKEDIKDLSCGFAIKDRRGTVLWGITNMTQLGSTVAVSAGDTLQVTSSGVMWLATGDYFLSLGAAHGSDGSKIDFVEDAIAFRVIGPKNIFTTSVVNLQAELTIEVSAHDRQEAY